MPQPSNTRSSEVTFKDGSVGQPPRIRIRILRKQPSEPALSSSTLLIGESEPVRSKSNTVNLDKNCISIKVRTPSESCNASAEVFNSDTSYHFDLNQPGPSKDFSFRIKEQDSESAQWTAAEKKQMMKVMSGLEKMMKGERKKRIAPTPQTHRPPFLPPPTMPPFLKAPGPQLPPPPWLNANILPYLLSQFQDTSKESLPPIMASLSNSPQGVSATPETESSEASRPETQSGTSYSRKKQTASKNQAPQNGQVPNKPNSITPQFQIEQAHNGLENSRPPKKQARNFLATQDQVLSGTGQASDHLVQASNITQNLALIKKPSPRTQRIQSLPTSQAIYLDHNNSTATEQAIDLPQSTSPQIVQASDGSNNDSPPLKADSIEFQNSTHMEQDAGKGSPESSLEPVSSGLKINVATPKQKAKKPTSLRGQVKREVESVKSTKAARSNERMDHAPNETPTEEPFSEVIVSDTAQLTQMSKKPSAEASKQTREGKKFKQPLKTDLQNQMQQNDFADQQWHMLWSMLYDAQWKDHCQYLMSVYGFPPNLTLPNQSSNNYTQEQKHYLSDDSSEYKKPQKEATKPSNFLALTPPKPYPPKNLLKLPPDDDGEADDEGDDDGADDDDIDV